MAHGHGHGLVHASIKRSRPGVRVVALALVVLAVTAAGQAVVFVASSSVALLADLIHNAGDAATAIPLGIAFAMRSERAERLAGLVVVAAIFVSACVAGYEAADDRLVHPQDVDALGALALAGALGFAGNWVAAIIRTRAGQRLDSPPRRRRRPRPGRRVRLARRHRLGRRRRARRARRRSAHRPRHHHRHPAHHVALVGHGPRARPRPPPMTCGPSGDLHDDNENRGRDVREHEGHQRLLGR